MSISSHRERAFILLRDKATEELVTSLKHIGRIASSNDASLSAATARKVADDAIVTLSAAISRFDETIAACDTELKSEAA